MVGVKYEMVVTESLGSLKEQIERLPNPSKQFGYGFWAPYEAPFVLRPQDGLTLFGQWMEWKRVD